MTIRLDEKDYMVCIWQADDLDDNNFLMLLRKREGCYLIDYRFRYKKDDKIFDSADEKSFHCIKSKSDITELEALKACQEIFHYINEQYCMHSFCQRINGGLKEFKEVLERYNCFHTKSLSLEEAESLGLEFSNE